MNNCIIILEHQRLNFWYTERLLSMESKSEISIPDEIVKARIDPEDFMNLAVCLSSEARLKYTFYIESNPVTVFYIIVKQAVNCSYI